MRLQNKVALVTGAAAIKGEFVGFGGAAAHRFVREGAKVILTDIRDELGGRGEGQETRYIHLDLTSEQNWAHVVDAPASPTTPPRHVALPSACIRVHPC
jgi:3alpha(or 20beta)-hydroxysteroid dehydrogenase